VQEYELLRRHSGQCFQHRPRKQLERDHGRDGISRQAEEVLEFSRRGRRRYTSEHDWPSGLNLGASEEKLRLKLGQDLFHQVVLAHGNSTGEQQ
jgi:hypothetical protein